MATPKVHKLKSISTYEDYIALCGKTVHKYTVTQNPQIVTCKNCRRKIDNA